MRISWTLSVALAAIALGACGGSGGGSSDAGTASGTFVGTLSGTDAYVAVVVGKENVVAYVCDGERGVAQLFAGRRSQDTFTSRVDGARIAVELSEGRATGRVVLAGGRSGRFSAEAASGEAGFYRTSTRRNGRQAILGWVVLGDGSQRGALTSAGRTVAAPTLQPSSGTFTLSGRTLIASRISPGSAAVSGQSGHGGQFTFGQ